MAAEIKETIEVEADVVDVNAEIKEKNVMDKIIAFGKKNKKALIIAGTVVLGVTAVVVKAVVFPGEVDELEDASADVETEVF